MFQWIDRHLKTLLEIWVVLFTILVVYMFVTQREEISHNKTRSNQAKALALKVEKQQKLIQEGRLHSCRTTYKSIGDLLIPLAKTPKQKKNVPAFKAIIAKKMSGCSKQIKAPKKERG